MQTNFMADVRRKWVHRNPRGDRRVVSTFVLCLALLLLFVDTAGTSTAAGGDVRNLPAASFGPGPQFAIADLDGDVRPDLASIQSGVNSVGDTNYWIQLQLSATGPQSIRLVAPAGGLLIEARDVNGDHAIDLVFATAWHRQPVAILLNDGHGSFSRIEPTVFPGAFRESKTDWVSSSNELADSLGPPPQSRAGIFPEAKGLLRGRSPTSSILFCGAEFLVNPFLVSHAGRAPPSEVLLLLPFIHQR
jgi:hypothetical protein